ncbi:MAG: hypothetical protein KA228_11115 [Flavobacterium sp.]|nr:hypothetical protein [Flavobacterium sp.]
MNKIVIIIGIIIAMILILGHIQIQRWKNKLQKINNSRPKLTRSEYINRFVNSGFDKKHVEVVYDEIREFISMDDFSIYPEDDIHKVYRIEDLDDLELIDNVCEILEIKKAEPKDCDELNKKLKVFNAEYILTLTKKLAEEIPEERSI